MRPASCQPPTSSYSAPRLQWIARRSVRMWPKLRCVSYFILNEIKTHRLSLETMSDLGGFSASPTVEVRAVICDNVPQYATRGLTRQIAMEREVRNGSRHGPLPERIR